MKRRDQFEVFKGQDGDWYYRFRAANGRITSPSEGYRRKGAAVAAIRRNVEKQRATLASADGIVFVEGGSK